MKFSIIIPAYNAEKTLAPCLESVRTQRYSNYEVIIVDDGSSDETSTIAQSFFQYDMRFRYFYQQNKGVSAARNFGIKHARGEFIVFLDSDDQYDKEYLQEFDKMTSEYVDFDHFWCGFKSFDLHGEEVEISTYDSSRQNYVITNRSEIMNLHEKTLDAALWNKAFRKSILDEHHILMDEKLSLGEDILFNFAYLDVSRSSIVINNKPLYRYTKAPNGTLDSKFRENLYEIYEILHSRMLAYLQNWNVSQKQMAKYYNSVLFAGERALYNTYRAESTLTKTEKKQLNRTILKSVQFQTALNQADCSINPLYRYAYKIRSWNLIMLLNVMRNIKEKLTRE